MTRTLQDLLSEAETIASQKGYRIVYEWLDGCAGGQSYAAGKNWIFVDRMLTELEQLRQITDVLRGSHFADVRCWCDELWPQVRAKRAA